MKSILFRTKNLSLHFFKEQYYGSLFGPMWLVVEPIIFASIVWFFFFYALKAVAPSGMPFAGWLMSGMAIWILSATVIGSCPGFIKKNFLLSRLSNLSISQSLFCFQLSSLPVHLVFIFILVIIDLMAADGISAAYFWLPLFLCIQMFFFHCFGLLLAILGAFFRDVQSSVGVIMQIMMWSSPIFWDPATLPPALAKVMMFNPMYLPIMGYRHAIFGLEFPSLQAWFSFGVLATIFFLLSALVSYNSRNTIGDYL